MQVRRARDGVLAAVLGLAVLVPLGAATAPFGAVASAVAAGRLLLVRHAGTAPVTVDTTTLAGPALRAWWADEGTGDVVDAGSVPRDTTVTLHPPDTGDGSVRDWTLVVVDATRGLVPPP